MAVNNAKEAAGDGGNPIASETASSADETLAGDPNPSSVDDGYTPADEDAGVAERTTLGEAAADVVDDKAEEAASAVEANEDDTKLTMLGDTPNDEIDQPQSERLETEIEDLAMSAPVSKQRPVKKAKSVAEAGDALDDLAKAAAAPVSKNRPTRTRKEATKSDAPKKTGLRGFLSQVIQELKKVSWPTGAQLAVYFVVVLLFVLFMIAFIGGLDVLFGWIMLKLFG